jgi:hypothetical protein
MGTETLTLVEPMPALEENRESRMENREWRMEKWRI